MKNTITVIMQSETVSALAKIPQGTVAARSARLGVYEGEPLLVMADALLSYAKAYRARFESPIGEDGVLGKPYCEALAGVRALLNGDGAVAMRRGITTDSKDNGSIESIYWAACEAAGVDGNNI
jgi:hypothetical protein